MASPSSNQSIKALVSQSCNYWQEGRPMPENSYLTLHIVQDGHLWNAVDVLGEVRAQCSSKEMLEDDLPLIVDAIQTAAAMRQQLRNTGQVFHGDACWIC
jgi:hypothetical protein